MHDHHDGCGCGGPHEHHAHQHAQRVGGAFVDRSGLGPGSDDGAPPVLAISVGNSRTSAAIFRDGQRAATRAWSNEPVDALSRELAALAKSVREEAADIVVASVNDPLADRLILALERADDAADADAILRIGRDLPVPIRHTLDESGERTVGHDRLLAALGAFAVAGQACIVVDAGTAITVDFVDGEGTFHGGAIAPGARAMLGALHERTSALPAVSLARPESLSPGEPPFGKNTPQAMLNGVVFAARGLVRILAERYAEHYAAYPQIVATGGDAALLFEGDELIEAIVPDLVLRGVAVAHRAWVKAGDRA